MFNIVGIVALALGMTTGIVYAETGTGTLRVEPYPCDRSNNQNAVVEFMLTRGDLDFGTVPPLGNTTVGSVLPLALAVNAGCAAGGWTVDMKAGPFVSVYTDFSSQRLTLSLASSQYDPDPHAVADLEFFWRTHCPNPVPSDIPALFHPITPTTVTFNANGELQTPLVDASGSTVECSPGAFRSYNRGMGNFVAEWNAELNLTGVGLEPGTTYQSVLIVELNPSVI